MEYFGLYVLPTATWELRDNKLRGILIAKLEQ